MKVLIVDDEKPARERLKQLLLDLGNYEICGEAADGLDALEIMQSEHPDIALLDIRMPHMDGIETAQHLGKLEGPPAIIFTTAYEQHALEAFEANATAYLLKPVRKANLEKALSSARVLNRAQLNSLVEEGSTFKRPKTHISARLGMRLELIPINDIYYFQADQKYVTVCHKGGEAIIEDSLKSLESDLGQLFLRIHRNALVSTAHLGALEKTVMDRYQVIIKNVEERLEVSRRHVASVRRFLRSR